MSYSAFSHLQCLAYNKYSLIVIVKRKGMEEVCNVEDIKGGFLDLSHLEASPFPFRNVSSERSEARRKLRECDGLVDALIFIVQAEIGQKDSDSKVS